MTPHAAVLAEESNGLDAGPGLLGFLVLAFLVVSLVLLYRSMRKQMKKVDYDDQGLSDEERMRRHERPE